MTQPADRQPRREAGDSDRAEKTRAQILDAALRIFARQGPDGSSVRDIAVEAGVTKSLIHHHFGSKEGLFNAVMEAGFRPYYDMQRAMLEGDAVPTVELLASSMRAFFRFHLNNADFTRLAAHRVARGVAQCGAGSAGGAGESGTTDLGADLFLLGAAKLQQAYAAGRIRPDVEPRLLLMFLLNSIRGWFLLRHEWRGVMPDMSEDRLDEAYLETVLDVVLAGAQPSPVSDPSR